MNADRGHRGLVFYKWLVSYLLVLLVPIGAGLFFYLAAGSIVNEEIRNANELVVGEIGRTIDETLRAAERLSWQVGEHPRIQTALTLLPPLTDYAYYGFYTMYREFGVQRRYAGQQILTYYVLLRNLDSVVSPEGFRSSWIHYQQFHGDPEYSYEEWRALLSQYHRRRFVVLPALAGDRPTRRVAMLHSLPEQNTVDPPGTLVVLLDLDVFLNAIQRNRLAGEGFSLILDSASQVVASTGPARLDPSELDGLSGQTRFVRTVDGTSYVVQVYRSQVTDWTYVAAIPEAILIDRASMLVRIALAALAVCLVFGILAAYYQSVLRYNPIKRIVAAFAGGADGNGAVDRDEIRFIEQSVIAALNEKRALVSKVSRRAAEVRSYLLAQLCHGAVSVTPQARDELADLGVAVDERKYALFLVTIEDTAHFLPGRSEQSKAELARVVIQSVFDECLSPIRRVVSFELDNHPAFLLAWTPDGEITERPEDPNTVQFFSAARRALEFIGEHYHLELTVAGSSRADRIDDLPRLYKEALTAMEYRLVRGTGGVIVYKQTTNNKRTFDYPIELEQQLITSIRCGDAVTALEILDRVYQANFERQDISTDMARCLIFDLVNTMVKTVSAVISDGNGTFWDDVRPVRRLLACETSEQIRGEMTEIIRTVCDFVNRNKKSHNEGLKERVVAYLQENYRDPGLCTAGIASGLEMNPAYLTRFFKEQTGFGIAEYLVRYRVQCAKDDLTRTSKSVRVIAEEVGFGTANSLIRSFKRHEGITPQQFRELGVAVGT